MQKPSEGRWTILDLVNWTTAYFKSHHIDSPRLTVELLLAELLDIDRIELYMRFDQPLAEAELSRFKQMIKRRLRREPLAYILGRKDFWETRLEVDPSVLIPRPETEFLVEAALAEIPEGPPAAPMKILELGTGSGAIVVSLAAQRPGHLFFASDVSVKALAVARANAASSQVADQIGFFAGSWLEPVGPSADFDLLVSNPPYVPCADIPELAPEICRYEPASALDGGPDGLSAIRCLIDAAPACMKNGAKLYMEIGEGQSAPVRELLARCPQLAEGRFIRDYSGIERVVEAVRVA